MDMSKLTDLLEWMPEKMIDVHNHISRTQNLENLNLGWWIILRKKKQKCF